jgi:hypothetical protein
MVQTLPYKREERSLVLVLVLQKNTSSQPSDIPLVPAIFYTATGKEGRHQAAEA